MSLKRFKYCPSRVSINENKENVRDDSQLTVKMELKIEIVCHDGEYVIGTYYIKSEQGHRW